jgi:pimeloyl-ACP methyl ester carboxylesterase
MRLARCTITVAVLAAATLAASQPAATRQMPVNGTELTYVDHGQGTPVVFVHGAVGDLRLWEPQRAAFSKSHRFVAYTFRYHGTGKWPDDGKQYSVGQHAKDLAAFIGGLKAGRVHLVGLSLGGVVASTLALEHPDLVRTLTLAEPGLFSVLAGAPDGKAALDEWRQALGPMGAAIQAGDATGATRQLAAFVTGRAPEDCEKISPALRQILLDNARTLPPLFAAPSPVVTCEQLRGLKVPTLVVRGERTPDAFAKVSDVVARCTGAGPVAVVPGATHVMSYDNPAAFNRIVLDFIAEPAQRQKQPEIRRR